MTTPPTPPILIAGIGNIFLGDDGFGVEVAQRLMRRPHPPEIRVVDFGIRGLDLVYALLDGCVAVILIDAVQRGDGPPGTLYLLEPQLDLEEQAPPMDPHSMDPAKVLRAAKAMGATPRETFIVGCEPTANVNVDDGDQPLGLSPPIAAAVDEAVAMVESLAEKIRARILPNPGKIGRMEVHT